VDKQKDTNMKERYWNASGDVPEAILDWVNDNVVEALRYWWEEDEPTVWADVEDSRFVLVVAGPMKPEPNAEGREDIYSVRVDLLELLTEYGTPYEDSGPCSDAQREDMRERAAELRKLADSVSALAARAAQAG
jgi:hypothetical protein